MEKLTQSKRTGQWLVFVVLLSALLVGATLLMTGGQTARADPGVIYVNADATGAGTGESWEDAFTTVREALAEAVSGDEIWVAEGVYKPTEGVKHASCQAIRDAFPDAPDGTYLINPGGQVVQVYCADMATGPVAYLSLSNRLANTGNYEAGGSSPGTNVQTSYIRVRLLTNTWRIDISDQRSSISSGKLDHDGTEVTSMPYGVAMDCMGPDSATASARIDLRDTPFFVADTFIRCGVSPGGTWTFSDDDQVVVLTGGGDCGWVQPAADCLDPPYNDAGGPQPILDLGYLGVERRASFELKSGVALYGGFDGTESSRGQRNPQANPTVLSGDIDDNDGTDLHGVVTDTTRIAGTNAYHVVSAASVTETAVLDGFIITAGEADGTGGFIHADLYSSGGGMTNHNSKPTLANVTFSGNKASYGGGGMYNYRSSPRLSNVTFNANLAGYDGGGMYNEAVEDFFGTFVGRPRLTNVTFSGNKASFGGGIHNKGLSRPTLTNVTFSGNKASYGGGMGNWESNPALTNVTFGGNQAWRGGGLYNFSNSAPKLVNCILWGNEASDTADVIYNSSNSWSTISYSDIQDGCDAILGNECGPRTINLDPLFVAPVGASQAPTGTGNYRLRYDSPAIDAGNTVSVTIDIDLDGNPRVLGNDVDMGAYEHQGYRLGVGTVGEGDVAEAPAWPTYTYLDQVVLTATARAGWTFAHWSGDVESSENPLTLVIQDDTDITATFTELPPGVYGLIVETVGNGGVTLDPPGGVYDEGTLVELTAEADPSWQFSGWSGDLSGAANPESITMDGDKSVTATFTEVGENKIYLPLVVRND